MNTPLPDDCTHQPGAINPNAKLKSDPASLAPSTACEIDDPRRVPVASGPATNNANSLRIESAPSWAKRAAEEILHRFKGNVFGDDVSEVEAILLRHAPASPAESGDTRRLNWLEGLPLANVYIRRVEAMLEVSMYGWRTDRLRELIDAAMADELERDHADQLAADKREVLADQVISARAATKGESET